MKKLKKLKPKNFSEKEVLLSEVALRELKEIRAKEGNEEVKY